jgi:hypothetical protein
VPGLTLAVALFDRVGTPVAVTEELFVCGMKRVGRIRVADLGFHDDERDAVHEQDDVRMMKLFTHPGVSMRNWLMAWNRLRSGWAKSIRLTTGSLSPVTSLRST